MTQKWNLQDIHPSEPRRRSGRRPQRSAEAAGESRRAEASEKPTARRQARGRGRRTLAMRAGVGVAVLLVLVLIGGMFLSGAEITLYPKHRTVTVQTSVVASKDGTDSMLTYELLTLEAEGERQVEASGTEEVTTQAEGTIRIVNEYSTGPIRLVKNTRFASPEGLIFKIKESAVVPGYTEDASGEIEPGVTTAEVFSDGTGEDYNLEPTRFTIPGFEGEPEYDAVYAESTESFAGGFDGERYIVAENELEAAKESLHEELRAALRERLRSEYPAGLVLYEDAVTFSFTSLPASDGGDGKAIISESAQLAVPLFAADTLAGYIAENTISGYEGGPMALQDPQTLAFSFQEGVTALSEPLTFELRGEAVVVWTFDEDALRNDLAGLSKTALPTVLSGYSAIEKAEATVRPFWRQSFPEDVEKIQITTKLSDAE